MAIFIVVEEELLLLLLFVVGVVAGCGRLITLWRFTYIST
jgi:hypothetical protein